MCPTWKPIDGETPKGQFVLTKRLRANNPPAIIMAKRSQTFLWIWHDFDGNVIPIPDEYTEVPQ